MGHMRYPHKSTLCQTVTHVVLAAGVQPHPQRPAQWPSLHYSMPAFHQALKTSWLLEPNGPAVLNKRPFSRPSWIHLQQLPTHISLPFIIVELLA
ncbi:hypothetical protein GQ54DRAFT_94301 [Martensiomyces pterosporus]|nr:hypothetical protein GQ54DRAFT_94301 [Martensiomyces pterosporus]